MILVLAIVMVGCAGGASRNVGVPLVIEEGGIRTYAEYAEAVKKEREVYIEVMQAEKEKPAVFVVRELGKLPSEVSRRYAAELAEVLGRRGVQGLPRADVAGGTKTVSYEEIAKAAALTYLLTYTSLDVARVVATHCPCDDTVFNITMAVLGPRSYGGFFVSSTERRERKEVAQQAIKRILDEQRPMNLTRMSHDIYLYLMGFWSDYLFVIDDPSGHDCKDRFDAVGRMAERAAQYAQQYEPPERVWKGYERIRSFKDDEHWQKKIQEMDAKLMQIYPATAAMKVFCGAVNRGDEEAVWEYMGDARFFVEGSGWLRMKDAIKKGDLCATILGEGYDRIACDYVALVYSEQTDAGNTWKMRAVASGPGGSGVALLDLEPTEDGKAWKVMLIWPAKKGRGRD